MKSFTQQPHLTKHNICHYKDGLLATPDSFHMLQCKECGNAFHGEKPVMCDLCENRFVNKGLLFDHMKTHTGEKPYQCYVCGKSFATVNQLCAHEK